MEYLACARPPEAAPRPLPHCGLWQETRLSSLCLFFSLAHEASWIVAPQPGIKPWLGQREHRVLTTGPPGNSLVCPSLFLGSRAQGLGPAPLLVSPIPAPASGWSLGYGSTILNQAPVQPPPWPGEEAHPGFPVPHSPPLSISFTGSSLLILALKLLRSQLGAFEATLLTFPPLTDSWEIHPTLEFSRPYLSSWFPALRSLFVPPPPGSRH